MDDVLGKRHSGLAPPIQMCDALSLNIPKTLRTLLANCLAHGRRRFVDLYAFFPEQSIFVIEALAKVYHYEDITQEQHMSGAERLAFHQTHSGPVMDTLNLWLHQQIETKRVEPNSGMGQAISYMLRHWDALTLFLRVENAPLDNNVCEQAIKLLIKHRKNSLFYKTKNGAAVGDLFMSIIHTCILNKVNPFEYIVIIQKYRREVSAAPHLWMPWNYKAMLPPASL